MWAQWHFVCHSPLQSGKKLIVPRWQVPPRSHLL
uniref:Uncharacterized protein n=1 Tax=Arundo donax TaxID=35708 RepID=A0A0A9DCL4_ARUDO